MSASVLACLVATFESYHFLVILNYCQPGIDMKHVSDSLILGKTFVETLGVGIIQHFEKDFAFPHFEAKF